MVVQIYCDALLLAKELLGIVDGCLYAIFIIVYRLLLNIDIDIGIDRQMHTILILSLILH